jgi:hypothetical protein
MDKYNEIIYNILFWFTVLACILSPIYPDMEAVFWPSFICTVVIGLIMEDSGKMR